MAKRITALEWMDRMHILTTFAVCLAEEEKNTHCNLGSSREVSMNALIATLGLEAFSSTAAEEAFNQAFEHGEAYRAARDALGNF